MLVIFKTILVPCLVLPGTESALYVLSSVKIPETSRTVLMYLNGLGGWFFFPPL